MKINKIPQTVMNVNPFIAALPPYDDYQILIFDLNGNLVDVRRELIDDSTFTDIVNGGSADASFVVPRSFIDSGFISYGFRVQLYLYNSKNPWYDGRVMEFDKSQQTNSELITIHCEGWSTKLADVIVSEILSPGVQPNGTNNGFLTLDNYLTHLASTYIDSSLFGQSYISALPYYLDKLSFDGQELNTCIDDAVTQITDNSGAQIEWFVRGTFNSLPALVVQPTQNPNVTTIGRTSPTINPVKPQFIYCTKDVDITDYVLQNSARQLYNMIALYGGKDPLTNVQVYGAFKDSTSISLYGLRQKQVTNSVLLSQQSLVNYATVYLLLNAYPQPQGSFVRKIADDGARAGVWFQIFLPGEEAIPPQIEQVRAVKVTTEITNDKVTQKVYTSAPRPFIDQAYYGSINASANRQARNQARIPATQLSNYYILQGGLYNG